MVDNPSGSGQGLALQPHMIPKLQEAFRQALDELTGLTEELRRSPGLKITEPAMRDGATLEFQADFNRVAEEASREIAEYQQRLRDVVGTLDAIQQAYDRREYETAAELSSQLEP